MTRLADETIRGSGNETSWPLVASRMAARPSRPWLTGRLLAGVPTFWGLTTAVAPGGLRSTAVLEGLVDSGLREARESLQLRFRKAGLGAGIGRLTLGARNQRTETILTRELRNNWKQTVLNHSTRPKSLRMRTSSRYLTPPTKTLPPLAR